jgi:hypothetical protein
MNAAGVEIIKNVAVLEFGELYNMKEISCREFQNLAP